MAIDLTGKVAIVTGAGGGLGRAHALALARSGARVVVNDLGGALDGVGASTKAAETVVAEIEVAGGQAMANGASVTEPDEVEAMIEAVTKRWGGVDILVANAGILRDRSFAKMSLEDFRAVLDVHVMGSANCAKAVWNQMRDRNYGRIIFTSSSSGLWGNFGQANYGAAKMALVGLMNTLAIEGAKYNIKVNCLAPTAGTRMLDGLMPDAKLAALDPALVSPAVLALAADAAPTGTILCAGSGTFAAAHVTYTQGAYLGGGDEVGQQILDQLETLTATEGQVYPENGAVQGTHELSLAGFDNDGNRVND